MDRHIFMMKTCAEPSNNFPNRFKLIQKPYGCNPTGNHRGLWWTCPHAGHNRSYWNNPKNTTAWITRSTDAMPTELGVNCGRGWRRCRRCRYAETSSHQNTQGQPPMW